MVLEYSIIAIVIGLAFVIARWYIWKKKLNGLALAKAVASDVVKAVEQSGKELNSQQKKTLAVDMMNAILQSQGVKLDISVVSALIEAAVWVMNFFIKPDNTTQKQ